jgi:hypothetical protein
MKRIVAICVVLAIPCAAHTSDNPQKSFQDVNFCELVRNPSAFSGKRIRVRAIYRYFFEIDRLEAPSCCPKSAERISVQVSSDLEGKSRTFFRSFPKAGLALGTFVGTLETGDNYGTLGERSRLLIDEIESVEHAARFSKRKEPRWVPKGCDAAFSKLRI